MKLTVELVPASCWYSNVRSNVTSATWDRLQKETAQRSGYRCEICGGKGAHHPIEAHEVWEYNDALLCQRLVALTALCPACHEVKHFGHALKIGRAREALTWLAQVNSLSAESALAHVRQALDQQSARSSHTWKLDLAVLTSRYGVRLDRNYRELC